MQAAINLSAVKVQEKTLLCRKKHLNDIPCNANANAQISWLAKPSAVS